MTSPWRLRIPPAVVSVTAGVGIAAVATYVFLIAAARAVPPEEYAAFSVFWVVLITLSLGLFVPLEQETARRAALLASRSRGTAGLRVASVRFAAFATVLVAVLVVAGLPVLRPLLDDDTGLLVLLVLGCAAYGVQFTYRGLLSPSGQFTAYGAMVGAEGLLRCLAALGLLVVGVGAPAWYGGAMVAAVPASILVGLAVAGRRRVPRPAPAPSPDVSATTMAASTGRLVAAAVFAQLLLNGGVLVAKGFAPPGEAVLAGHLLATITITRVPVFLLQPLQTSLLPRIAAASSAADPAALHSMIRRLASAVGLISAAGVVGAAIAGPWVVGLLFGAEFALSRGLTTLLAAGVCAFMVALCSSDITVALGGHTRAVVAWGLGVAVAVVVVLAVPDLGLRATLPLLAGATVAALVLVPLLYRSVWAGTPGDRT